MEARIDRYTRVVAISTAMFATGFKNDIAALGELCEQCNIYFVVDGIQTLGAFPIDVQACHIDFLASAAHKWLMGQTGYGFLYCRHELMDELKLGAYVGATSTVDAANYLDYNFTLQPDADRFNVGANSMLGMIAFNASLGLLLEVGIDTFAEGILALNAIAIEDLQQRGFRIRSNLEPANRSRILIVEVADPAGTYEMLHHGRVITSPRGAGIWLSPHFYNNEADMLRVGEVLGKAESQR